MRRSILLASSLALGCASAQKAAPPPAAPTANAPVGGAGHPAATAATATASSPAAPRCSYSVRRVSAAGRGALRPQVAAIADAFAVAWEETTDHRSIRVQTFALDAQPLGSSIEVADVARSAAEPRLAANPDGDGFAVFWSADGRIDMRRIDRAGKPKSDVIPVVVAAGARALDVAATENGYAIAWWNWSGTPHQLAVTFVDKEGRAVGKPLPITRAPSPDPTVDITRGATLGRRAQAVLAWDETVGDAEHVIFAELLRDHLEARVDFGPGETPRIGADAILFDRALADKGLAIFRRDNCDDCHSADGTSEGVDGAPNFAGHASLAWIERLIRNGGDQTLFSDHNEMPKFGPDKLSDEDVAALAALIARQRS